MKRIYQMRTKIIAIISVIVFVFSGVAIILNQNVSADQYENKIKALQADMAKYQAEGDRLNQVALSLQGEIDRLASEKNVIQAQIDINQIEHDQLVEQIKETESQLQNNRDSLGFVLADMYVDDTITPIEMLASSKSLSDFLDKQEQRSATRNQLNLKIEEIKQLKKELEESKTRIAGILSDQKTQRDILVNKEAEQRSLRDRTKGQEASYQKMIEKNKKEIDSIRAVQAALAARVNSTGGVVLISGGLLMEYPWNSSNCPMTNGQNPPLPGFLSTQGADGNGGDGWGYGCRQCASYVAWRVAKETGKYYKWGNAKDFYQNALNAGYQKSEPQAGCIGVMFGSTTRRNDGHSFGHVVWVETDPYIDSRGRKVIQISQYNYNYGAGFGMYSRQEVSVNLYDAYVKIK